MSPENSHDETHQLDWLAADGVHGCYSDPVTWHCAGEDQDDVADGDVFIVFIDVVASGIADGS